MPINPTPTITGWTQPQYNNLAASYTYNPAAGLDMALSVAKYADATRESALKRRLDEMYLQEHERELQLKKSAEEWGTQAIQMMQDLITPQPQEPSSQGGIPGSEIGTNRPGPVTPTSAPPSGPPNALGPVPTGGAQGKTFLDIWKKAPPAVQVQIAIKMHEQQQALAKDFQQKQQDAQIARLKDFETGLASMYKTGDLRAAKSYANFYKDDSDPRIRSVAAKMENVKFSETGAAAYKGYFDSSMLNIFRNQVNEDAKNKIPVRSGFYDIKVDKKGDATVAIFHLSPDELVQSKTIGSPEEKAAATEMINQQTQMKQGQQMPSLVGFTEKGGGLPVFSQGTEVFVSPGGKKEAITDEGKYGKITPKTTTQMQLLTTRPVDELMGGKENANFHYERYARFGILPPLGFTGLQRYEFLGNAAKWARTHDIDPTDSVVFAAEKKSLDSSLSNMQKQYNMTDQAIKQSNKNAHEVFRTSDSFTRSDYPAPNKIIQWTGQQVGSQKLQAEIGQFKVALQAFQREYMRIVTGAARSVAELSIHAQMSGEEILSQFNSWSTLKAQVDQANREINNVQKSYTEELGEVKGAYKKISGAEWKPEKIQHSEEDLKFTAKKHGITVDEVKRRLGVQ